MDDLAAFLRAQWDAEEAAAKAATPGPWHHTPGKMWLPGEAFESYDLPKGEEFVGYGGPSPFTGCVAATGPASHPQSMADATHIARHDPARVLADIAAKRRILDEHAHIPGDGINFTLAEQTRAEETLKLLALPYADVDGYKGSWRP